MDKNKNESRVLSKIHKLITDEDYIGAQKLIEKIKSNLKNNENILLYKAICTYERGEDTRCLELLLKLLKENPFNPKFDYIIFTAATCLINIGLEKEALELIRTLPLSYPDRNNEEKNLNKILESKEISKKLFKSIYKIICSKNT